MNIKIETTKKHTFYANINWEDTPPLEIDPDRKMGAEYLHVIEGVSLVCPTCKDTIVRVEVYEYPDGGFNYAIGYYQADID